jgi:hypothetical protein
VENLRAEALIPARAAEIMRLVSGIDDPRLSASGSVENKLVSVDEKMTAQDVMHSAGPDHGMLRFARWLKIIGASVRLARVHNRRSRLHEPAGRVIVPTNRQQSGKAHGSED